MRIYQPFLILCVLCVGCANTEKAEDSAKEYVRDLYPDATARTLCDTSDSDGNGKVRCTIVLTPNDGSAHFSDAVECPSSWLPQWSSQCVPYANRR